MPFDIPRPGKLIDVNVFLDRWPFRRLPDDETSNLVKKLRSQNVAQALAGSFDSLLHRDLRAVNQRLLAACQQADGNILRPMGAVNLTLPHWEQEVEDCAVSKEFAGVRILPGWHHVPLDDGRMAALCALCEEKQLILQIFARLEDPRTAHPQFTSQPIDFKPALELFPRFPRLRVILSNSGAEIRSPLTTQLAKCGQIYFDLSMVEQTGGVSAYAQAISPERLLFGSYFPFFYFEASLLKLQENEETLGRHQIDLIAFKNAERLLAGTL